MNYKLSIIMRPTCFIILFLSLCYFSFSQSEKVRKFTQERVAEMAKPAVDTSLKLPTIDFKSLVYDYGTIYKGKDGTCYFEFKNSGSEDLLLTNVSSSCGCTVPDWPKTPIAPGESSKIRVAYDTKKVGIINRAIYVDSNAGNRLTLTIKGNVEESPPSMPENTSSPMLRNN